MVESYEEEGESREPESPNDPGRLNLLLDVLLRMVGSDDRASLVSEFTSQLSWVLDFDRCRVELVDEQGTSFGAPRDSGPLSVEDDSLLIEVVRQSAPVRREDTGARRVHLGLPLVTGERAFGAVLLKSRSGGRFDRNDVRLGRTASTFLALALDRLGKIESLARVNDELRFAQVATFESHREDRDTAIVRESGDGQVGIESFDSALDLWARLARQVVGAHQSAVSFIPQGSIPEGKHAISMSDRYADYRTYDVLPTGEGIWRLVVSNGESFCLTDEALKSHSAWRNFSERVDARGLEHPPMRGWLAVPVLGGNERVVGVLQLTDKYEGDFDQDDLDRLSRLAGMMAPAFSLQAANEELQRRADELTCTMDALARSNDELEQFAYVASHDLQEPLRAVSGYSHLLEQNFADGMGEKARRWIDNIVDGAGRMQRLINDLLEYSRVERRGHPFRSVDLGAVVRRAIDNLRMGIEESGAELEYDELPTLIGDEGQLERLVQNLVGNAIKYRGDEPPRILIAAAEGPEEWRISVSDNGLGIAPEYHERIFQIFQRLHTRTEYPGTGIGLAICQRIVDRHGGRIRVDSEVDRGSTFHFTISKYLESDDDDGGGDARPVEILLVEDSPTDADLAREALSDGRVDNNLHHVTDGVEALAFLRRQGRYADAPAPDIVLLDLNMPRMDGRETLRAIRSDPVLRHLVVVVLTTSTDALDVREAHEENANAFIVKPVDLPQFVACWSELRSHEN